MWLWEVKYVTDKVYVGTVNFDISTEYYYGVLLLTTNINPFIFIIKPKIFKMMKTKIKSY